jgi:hypothetical protein
MNHQGIVEAVTQNASVAQKNVAIHAPAIENKPIAGGVVTIQVGLTPGMVMLLSGPLAVVLVMTLGWVVRTSFGMPLYGREMIGGGIVNIVGGIFAALPIVLFMKRGVVAIIQASMLAMVVRCGVILMGLMLALGAGWNLDRMPLAVWTLCCYFPLLMAETACIAWLNNKSTQ